MKIKKLPQFALLASVLLFSACATNGGEKADNAAAAIAAAEASNAKAKAAGYEWRDTGKMIKEAKKAAEMKDYDKAIKLAKKAENQGELAVKQQASETKRFQ